MTDTDKQAFENLMIYAEKATIVPAGKDLRTMAKWMFEELRAYPFEVVDAAVKEYCRTERFFPMLSDIVRRIEGDAEERAILAWALIKKTERKCGLSRSFRFPSPAIQFAVEALGGWRKLYYQLGGADERFLELRFVKFYGIAEKRGVTWADVETPYFRGDRELTALALGDPVPECLNLALVEAAS